MVTADVGHAAEQKDDPFDAALRERACDDEAVAAVVAAPAEDADAARGQVLERGLHRRDGLPPRVLHQDERRNADVLDRLAIGFTHLVGVEDAHQCLTRRNEVGPTSSGEAHNMRCASILQACAERCT
jgi:hypothetical protein